ncbi:carbohydrate ABC transporter permease [Paenibacillus eucommiae]|uniref:Multiple sugar transport system permease protein n=1 Tax=Paenibacillus eucommiae TaxID=1355755 RepID=A0ABS4ITQ2_9BACL|nr:carbohydrate ABC transporter permease [Paenibacillus eucommiae]MBP1990957.1 multiple sugar transport system permease protein [Paenibacillus eucommiae]
MKASENYRQIKADIGHKLHSRQVQLVKKLLLGQHLNDGWLAKIVIYFLLAIIAFLYLQPLFYMISTMVKSVSDLIDPIVKWIPRELHWKNLGDAWRGLRYPESFTNTLTIALTCSILQVVSCAITGYALARLHFPGKTLAFFLIIVTFLVPPQITIIPMYSIFGKLGWLNTPLVFIIPAVFGQGLRGALFIIIFRQFFQTQPKALEEAAKIDGASVFRLFFRIMLPLARPAIIVVFLFSFVWYWNMYYEPSMFLSKGFQPLSLRLSLMQQELMGSSAIHFDAGVGKDPISEGPKMAAAFLIILPPLIVYMFTQRWFSEGIERTGLVE